MINRKILSLCDYSGNWSLPYREAGYEVVQVDLKMGQDVRMFTDIRNVYGVLAAPPCDHLSAAGAQYWQEKGDKGLFDALSVVDACLRIILISRPYFWCLENPAGRLSEFIGKPVMQFHPYYYGDPWKKRTCLWGDFRIPKENRVEPTYSLTDKYKDKERRSNTSLAFAQAFFEANR